MCVMCVYVCVCRTDDVCDDDVVVMDTHTHSLLCVCFSLSLCVCRFFALRSVFVCVLFFLCCVCC